MIKKENQVNVNWDNYAANHGVVPNSLDENIRKENLSDAEINES